MPHDPVIVAALAAAGVAWAGYDDVRAYYLSFADLAKDERCSIIRDSAV